MGLLLSKNKKVNYHKLKEGLLRHIAKTAPHFKYDGCSTPIFKDSLFKKSNTSACKIHDYMYRKDNPYTSWCTREVADFLFYKFLLDDGVSPIVALSAYVAVRAFGESAFHRQQIANECGVCVLNSKQGQDMFETNMKKLNQEEDRHTIQKYQMQFETMYPTLSV